MALAWFISVRCVVVVVVVFRDGVLCHRLRCKRCKMSMSLREWPRQSNTKLLLLFIESCIPLECYALNRPHCFACVSGLVCISRFESASNSLARSPSQTPYQIASHRIECNEQFLKFDSQLLVTTHLCDEQTHYTH